jgi:hypothetical protein
MNPDPPEQSREFQLYDRERPIRFRGIQLAFASSDNDDRPKQRWYEITIYKTVGGNYVAQRVGKSRVYHSIDSDCRVPTHDVITVADLDDDEIPCPVCRPPDRETLMDGEINIELRGEVDRPTVEVWPDPAKLIKNLYVRDKDLNAYRLPKVVRRALSMASRVDEGIQEAYATEYVA